MGRPRYFLEIEVAHQKHGLLLSQRKYTLDLLEKTDMLGANLLALQWKQMWIYGVSSLDDLGQYRRLIEKFIYLTVTRPDITFAVGVLCRFMHQPREVHWTTAMRILPYIKSSPEKDLLYKKYGHVRIFGYSDSGYTGDKGNRKSTTGYCTFVGGNLVTWRSKKQDVSRSSVVADYIAMAHTACEIMWLKNLLLELGLRQSVLMPMFCDNESAILSHKILCFMRGLSI